MNTNGRKLGSPPRLKLNITQDIIDSAIERNSNYCIVAEAVKLANPKLKYVSVDIQTIRGSDMDKRERYVYITPRAAQQLIIDFDQGKKKSLIPFTVQLRNGQTIGVGQVNPDGTPRSRAEAKIGGQPPEVRARKRTQAVLVPSVNASSVPNKIGGKAPPKPVQAVGARRAFGLRALVI